jgi:hypothetical protein
MHGAWYIGKRKYPPGLWGLLDSGSELTLIPADLKGHCSLLPESGFMEISGVELKPIQHGRSQDSQLQNV